MAKRKRHRTLTPQEIKELKKIVRQNPGFSAQGNLGIFFDLYLVCEATARKLIYYKKKKNPEGLNINSIISCVNLFFPNKLASIPMENIFGSAISRTRNNKTCRQLRNSYIHNLSKEDKNEIDRRINILERDMQKWIKLFEYTKNGLNINKQLLSLSKQIS